MKILLIEDDQPISRVLKRGLEQHHFEVEAHFDGNSGLKAGLENTYSVILLDIMLPGRDGFEICRLLRSNRVKTPILMLTAKGDLKDKVAGFELGADDYLPKPFQFPELIARINALIRRDKIHKGRHIHIADLEIDTKERRVTRAGVEITLTTREFDLLLALASREGQVLTRDLITERVWMDEENYSNTVDVYIGLLRKKIDNNFDVKLIQTVRGSGYTLRRPSED